MSNVILMVKIRLVVFCRIGVSSRAVESKRILELTEMIRNMPTRKIFEASFLDFKTYKRFAENLEWETEVWTAEFPEYLMHLNEDGIFKGKIRGKEIRYGGKKSTCSGY